MRRKRKRKNLMKQTFNFASPSEARKCIKCFLNSILSQLGLINGQDYKVTYNHLKIIQSKTLIKGAMPMLKEYFPVFNFYWQSPRILVWF